jgi:ribosomal protein S11
MPFFVSVSLHYKSSQKFRPKKDVYRGAKLPYSRTSGPLAQSYVVGETSRKLARRKFTPFPKPSYFDPFAQVKRRKFAQHRKQVYFMNSLRLRYPKTAVRYANAAARRIRPRRFLKNTFSKHFAKISSFRRPIKVKQLKKFIRRLKSSNKFFRFHHIKPRRGRFPNVFHQFFNTFNYSFLYFRLRNRAGGRKVLRRVYRGLTRATARNFFMTPEVRRALIKYYYSAAPHRIRYSFSFPRSLYHPPRLYRSGAIYRRKWRAVTSRRFFKPATYRRSGSRYFLLNRYDRHRSYLFRLRRSGQKRSFFFIPSIGVSARLIRLRKKRHGSLLPFFRRRSRFRKLRRYLRLNRKKRAIVPLLRTRYRSRRLYSAVPRLFFKRGLVYIHMTQTTNNVFYSIFSRKHRLLATFSNGRTEFIGSKRISTVASESAAKTLSSYLHSNKVKAVFFVFSSRFNHFMRSAVRIFRAKNLRIAGFKYRMRKPHGLGLRKRASRRV